MLITWSKLLKSSFITSKVFLTSIVHLTQPCITCQVFDFISYQLPLTPSSPHCSHTDLFAFPLDTVQISHIFLHTPPPVYYKIISYQQNVNSVNEDIWFVLFTVVQFMEYPPKYCSYSPRPWFLATKQDELFTVQGEPFFASLMT